METDTDPSILRIARGRAWSETWLLLDDDDVAIDLTGCTLAVVVREKAGAAEIAGTVTITDATAGEILLSFTADQVATMSARVLHWRLELTDSLGALQTPGLGTVLMEDQP